MALIDRKTIVVIDDNIYDLMEFYKSVLCKKEFGFLPNNIKYIKLSDLSATIPADRIDDFGVYFYVFEKINTAEEYLSVTEKLRCTPNIEIAILHCQDATSFEVCDCQKKALCKIHCIGISEKFALEKIETLSEKELQSRNCLKLTTFLLYLLTFEEGSFEDYTVNISLNYPSIYCATQYPILQIGKEIDEIEKTINEEKKKIKDFQQEKPHKYSIDFAEKEIGQNSGKPLSSESDSTQALSQISVAYDDYEKEIDRIIQRDIEATRYAMAEIDEYAQGGAKPGCFKNKQEVAEVPDAKDLLRNVAISSGDGFNIKQAIGILRNLIKVEKPKIKTFLVLMGAGSAVFLFAVAMVYLASVLKSGTSSVNIGLLVTCLCVPLGIIIFAGIIGFIANILEYNKIKKLLTSISSSLNGLSKGMNSLVDNVREYLNDFITVFCNYHAKDYCISQCEKRIFVLEKEKDEKLSIVNEINAFPDMVKVLLDYEKRLDVKDTNKLQTDLFKDADIGVDYTKDAFDYENVADNQVYDKTENIPEKPQIELVKCSNCKQCIEYILKNSSTQISGNRAIPFEDSKSPWLLTIEIRDNMNGGVL